MERNQWGRRIKAFRKLKGYTQVAFARELGVSVTQLGEIERGERTPMKEQLDAIVEHLGISLEELEPKQKDL
ncbi:helix-turn-helix transcriptional regulator [Gracilibacillus sp. YIM 98692]|uniref:helix-turn-helix domain-containing protein n=1 Tax=Gracilibacillus sp. YIM 98692 TaxID=2663532 RepID=UPI0013D10804|nr:helix-turn-helix transcriptional regulator [Gracilibacillus sp. YIM 98692]